MGVRVGGRVLDDEDSVVSSLLPQSLVGIRKLAIGAVRDHPAGLVVVCDGSGTQEASFLNTFVGTACDDKDDGEGGPRQSTSGTRRCG